MASAAPATDRSFRLTLLLAASFTALAAQGQTLDDAFAALDRGDRRSAAETFATIAARDGAADPETGSFAGNNACMLLRELGDYDRARETCATALATRRRLGDPVALARTLNNYGLVLQDLGDYREAQTALREALALNRAAGEREAAVINLGNLGGCAALEGRYGDALALHREAIDLAASNAGEPWAAEQGRIARVNLGVVLEKLGAFEDALELYRGLLSDESLSPRHQADLMINAGTAYRNLGDPVSAETLYRSAHERYLALGDRVGLTSAALNLGIAYHLDLGRRDDAEAAYREALSTARAIGDATLEIHSLYYLGRLELDRGRVDDAGTLLSECLEAATAAGSREGRWSCRGALAATARRRGRDDEALKLLEAAVVDIEATRDTVSDPRLRAEYFGDRRSLYAATVDLLFDLDRREPGRGWATEALRYARRAKERELTDAIGRRTAATAEDAGTSDRRRTRRTLLELFCTENRVIGWLVIGAEVTAFDAGARQPIVAAARALHRELAAGRPPPVELARRLSEVLLAPIETKLPASGPLLVAPDGALHDLPFALLEVGRDRDRLIDHHEVSHLPSAALLDASQGDRDAPPSRLDFAAFAAPAWSLDAATAALDPRLRQVATLPPLPATTREASELAASFGEKAALRTGDQATERELRALATNGTRILHLATHTVVASDGGSASVVVLTPADGDDGLLAPREIAALDLDIDLAVLAACRTNQGWREGGGGTNSLTGAFLAAGAGSVIATLWDVGDEATAAFMAELYRHLRSGLTPAQALRRTQLRFRGDPRWNDPAIWAAFVAIGDGPPVASESTASRRLRVAAGIALVAVGLGVLSRLGARRRRWSGGRRG